MPQSSQNVGLRKTNSGFNFRLIPWTIWTRRQNGDAIVRCHHGVAAIDFGIVERGLVHAALEIIWNNKTRYAIEEAEHAHMRADPVRQRLRPARFRIGVIGSAKHGDEDL